MEKVPNLFSVFRQKRRTEINIRSLSVILYFCFISTFCLAGSEYREKSGGFNGSLTGLMTTSNGLMLDNIWIKQSPEYSPSARKWHAMWASDSKVYLFGGQESVQQKSDTYVYKGYWQLVNTSTSPPKRVSTKVYSDYLFGGIDPSTAKYFSDIWKWDASEENWQQVLSSTFPAARYGHLLATKDSKLYLHGGRKSGGYIADSWVYDTVSESWTEVEMSTYPKARRQHKFLDIGANKLFMFGGEGVSLYGDSWLYDVQAATWTLLATETSPSKRVGASMEYDKRNSLVVLYGGRDMNGEYLNDTWIYDPASNNWYLQSPQVSGNGFLNRSEADMAYYSSGGELVMFGGEDEDGELLSDTWVYVIRSSGVYESPVIDAGSVSTELKYKNITADAVLAPDADIKFRVASSTSVDPADYRGLGAYTTSYYVSGDELDTYHDNKRYFRFKLYMERELAASATSFYLSTVTVSYNHIPSKPVHVGPPFSSASDGGLASSPAVFSWYNSVDKDGDNLVYEILVSTESGFSSNVYNSTGIAETSLRTSRSLGLSGGSTYYWKVRAYDGSDFGVFSDSWQVFIDTVAPAAITVIAAEQADSNGAVNLNWICPESAYAYRVRWRSDGIPILGETAWSLAPGSMDFVSASLQPATEQSCIITGLADASTYWFSVKLRDEAGNYSGLSDSVEAKTNSPPEFRLLSDMVSEPWGTATSRSTSTVNFTFSVSDPDPGDTAYVDIILSRRSGAPYDFYIATGVTDGNYDWDSLEINNSSLYRIKFIAYDQKDLQAYITTSAVVISNNNIAPEVTINAPSGGEVWESIQNIDISVSDSNGEDELYCDIYVSLDGGSSFSTERYSLRPEELPYSWPTGNYDDSENAVIKAVVRDNRGASSQALSAAFTLRNANNPPEAFSLLAPQDNSFLYSTSTVFDWQDSSDGDSPSFSYTLVYSTLSDFSTRTEISSIDCSSRTVVLSDETRYYWYVDAVDDELVRRRSSDIMEFAIDTDPLRVTSINPASGSLVHVSTVSSITLQFNKSPRSDLPLHLYMNLEDNYSNKLNYDYTLDTAAATIVFSGDFLESREYTLSLGTEITDFIGHPLTSGRKFSFKNLLSSSTATELSIAAASLSIPAGLLQTTGFISLEQTSGNETEIADLAGVVNSSVGHDNVAVINVKAIDQAGVSINSFSREAELVLYYKDDGRGFVKDYEIDEEYLRIFKLESSAAAQSALSASLSPGWIMKGGTVNTSLDSVSIKVGAPGIYAVKSYSKPLADISGLIVYPNPFDPRKEELNIKFLLTYDMEIELEIYSLMEDLVYKDKISGNGDEWGKLNSFSWDGRNGSRSVVANGMYYARLMVGGKEKSKFLIGVLK